MRNDHFTKPSLQTETKQRLLYVYIPYNTPKEQKKGEYFMCSAYQHFKHLI